MPKKESTLLLYYKSDAKKYLSENFTVEKIFPLTPDTKAVIGKNTSSYIFDPLNQFSQYSHLRVVASVRSFERKAIKAIEKDRTMTEAGKETLISLLHVYLSSFNYLWFMLRGTGPWIVHDGSKWVEESNLSRVCFILIERIISRKKGLFFFGQNTNQYGKKLIKIVNDIAVYLMKNKKIIITTGQSYGLKKLTKNDNGILTIQLTQADKKSLFRTLKTLLILMSPFSKRRNLSISPVKKIGNNYEKLISNLFHDCFDSRLNKTERIFIKNLNNAVIYTESIIDSSRQILQKLSPKKIISHHLRWLDEAVLGQCGSELKIKTYLISHGSHPFPIYTVDEYEHRSLARGLLFSQFAHTLIAQSPIAEKSINFFQPDSNYLNYKPILWAQKKSSSRKNTDGFRILSAGTF